MKIKNIILIGFYVCGVCLVKAQSDSSFLEDYKKMTIESDKLNSELQSQKQKYSDLSNAYEKDTVALQKIIKDLKKELSAEKQKILELNKNKVIEEKDKLQRNVDSLSNVISIQSQSIIKKEKQIETEKARAESAIKNAKIEGEEAMLARIINSYKNRTFDELIKFSTRESVNRDMLIVGNNSDITPVLNDLAVFFNTQSLFSKRIDAIEIKNAQTQLNQIKRESKLLDEIKVDAESYIEYHTVLKENISKIVYLDESETTNGDSRIQKLKFDKIVKLLSDYMYNYYDYSKYPYLSDMVLEIVKRKKFNADRDISDLLKK